MKRERDQGAYWQEREDGFALIVDGRERAVANTRNGTALIIDGPGMAYHIHGPDSRPLFEEVEKRVGIGRVEEFRSSGDTDHRRADERRAEEFRARVLPGREFEHYARDVLWGVFRRRYHALCEKAWDSIETAPALVASLNAPARDSIIDRVKARLDARKARTEQKRGKDKDEGRQRGD